MVEQLIWFATIMACFFVAIPLALAVRGSWRIASRIGAQDPVLTVAVVFFTVLIFALYRFPIAEEFYDVWLAMESALP